MDWVGIVTLSMQLFLLFWPELANRFRIHKTVSRQHDLLGPRVLGSRP